MRINKQNIISSFQDYDQRVIDFMTYIIDDMKQLKIEINNYSLVMFQLLAVQLTIFFKALDTIQNGNKIIDDDNKKTPALNTLNKAHAEILRLLDKVGLSPLERAKIKKLNSTMATKDEAAADILAALVA